MNDAAYVYSQEVRERKRNSYGARNRKCGSKSKSCKLPTDYLSASQKRKLNGGVTVYQLKKPMSYEEFKKMPGDLQIQYLKFCVEMGGRKKDIAEMFGISTNTFDSYMYQKHKGEMTFKKGKNTASMQWLDWVTAPDGGVKEEETTPAVQEMVPAAINPECKRPTTGGTDLVSLKPEYREPRERRMPKQILPTNGTFTFTGKPEDVFTTALNMLGRDDSYAITITFTRNEQAG